ncbi:MAG TPA: hypothetical protein VF258_00170 [Luteolibacter sp.]
MRSIPEAVLRRASRARAVAASTNTPIHVMKDGKIVSIMPAEDRQPTPKAASGINK